jgi:hypothetical protein
MCVGRAFALTHSGHPSVRNASFDGQLERGHAPAKLVRHADNADIVKKVLVY